MSAHKNGNDRRLIEDYLPIVAISKEARREKSVRKGHISTLHLWWARRPLVASRAAVFGALVPAKTVLPEHFIEDLCTYPGSRQTLSQAEDFILQAHAERLTHERGEFVSVEDIRAGRAPRPRVLDMFAGGGAIPLEALRLGCEAYALDLNPVAHLIQLCTLVYPQQYGKPDPAARGSAADGTWAGLAAEVEHWGKWVLERVKAEIGDLYPPIPDPEHHKNETGQMAMGEVLAGGGGKLRDKHMLTPVAYLWTRTVRCPNPNCGGTVPLARQTWLAKKKNRYVALKPDAATNKDLLPGDTNKRVRYSVVQSTSVEGLGFDPESGSKGGNVVCSFCGTVINNDYVKSEAKHKRLFEQPIAIVAKRNGIKKTKTSRVYVSADQFQKASSIDEREIHKRIDFICRSTGLTRPTEPMDQKDTTTVAGRGFGIEKWEDVFTPRQLLLQLTISKEIHNVHHKMIAQRYDEDRAKAIATYIAFVQDRLADWNSKFCAWSPENTGGAKIGHTFARQALPMVWDFVESGVFSDATGGIDLSLGWIVKGLTEAVIDNDDARPANVNRGTATSTTWDQSSFDAIVTDPPYYDNISYAVLSDFFFVWLKRSLGHLYPEHLSLELTPKKNEAIADSHRHGGSRHTARQAYEGMMLQSFQEAKRVLKQGAPLIVVYAHKTTLGWSTLVDALRVAGFVVTESWPLDTEMAARMIALDSAALASSIFIVARGRENDSVGAYETDVRPYLEEIVRERVETLWAKGITGADLVIACVGAGLRAFTRYARVEYANGDEVPADKFLGVVEGVVLDTLLSKLFGVSRSGISSLDAATRFYVLWRYAYHNSSIDAGEAIVFAYPQGVELDGPKSLSQGSDALVEKKKNQYRLRTYADRGENAALGLPNPVTGPAPLIDVLHRVLWLMENAPGELPAYLVEAQPDAEQMRIVAQTLAGPALSGGDAPRVSSGSEASALRKLTTNWRALIEDNLLTASR